MTPEQEAVALLRSAMDEGYLVIASHQFRQHVASVLALCPVPVDPAQEAAGALRTATDGKSFITRTEREAALWTFLRYVHPQAVANAAGDGYRASVSSRLRDVCDRAGVSIPKGES